LKKNNRVKENQVMIDQSKIRKIKMHDSNNNENVIKTFIVLITVIILLIGGIYGLTELLKKDDNKNNSNITDGTINYDRVTVGTLLNRPYDDYYVLVYNSEDDNSILYSSMLLKYMNKSSEDNYIKIYYCDLNNSLNKKYYNVNEDNKSNPNATKISEFDFGDITLIKVTKGQIKIYLEDLNKIKEVLN